MGVVDLTHSPTTYQGVVFPPSPPPNFPLPPSPICFSLPNPRPKSKNKNPKSLRDWGFRGCFRAPAYTNDESLY